MTANPVPRPTTLKLETEKQSSETTVRATGRVTPSTSALLEETLRNLMVTDKHIILDLTNVDLIDSAGLGALVSIYMHARRTACRLKIANPKQRVRDLFTRSGLAVVFEGQASFDTLWEAWSSEP